MKKPLKELPGIRWMYENRGKKPLLRVLYFLWRNFRCAVSDFRGFLNKVKRKAATFLGAMKTLLTFLIYLTKILFSRKRLPSKGFRRTILMLTISQIEIDPRINKSARSFAGKGHQVIILCLHGNPELPQEEEPFSGVLYKRVPYPSLLESFRAFYQDTLLEAGLKTEFDIVYSNDLTSLIVGWMLSRLKGVPLVYDAHEIWTENVEYDSQKGEYVAMPLRKRRLLTAIERFIVKDVSLFISVSEGICREYQKRYSLKEVPFMLANFPELRLLHEEKLPSIRTQLGLSDEHFIILYIGGVNPARNIENVIRALPHLPKKCVFVIQGPGISYYGDEYKALAQSIGEGERLFCLGAVGRDLVIEAATTADCGVLMLRNLCMNFYLFYPNKFFEYMMAGIPVAVSNFPEVSAHLEREKCGITFDPDNPVSIAEAIKWLYEHPEECKAMGMRGKASVIKQYSWDKIFDELYKKFETL